MTRLRLGDGYTIEVNVSSREALRPDDTGASTDNPRISGGWTFFGQFIAHDITADRSLLLHHARLNELRNFRTPQLDLESMYAAGPTGSPHRRGLKEKGGEKARHCPDVRK